MVRMDWRSGGPMQLSDLTKLAELHQQGVLTDDEYEDQKARILEGEPEPTDKRLKWVAAICLAFVAIFAGWAIGSPYWTLHQIKAAAEREDKRALYPYIDLPAMREDLKAQMLSGAGKDEQAIAAIGSWFLDGLITKDMIAQGFIIYLATDAGSGDYEVSRTGFDSFNVTTEDGKIYFERNGLGWQIVGMENLKTNPLNGKPLATGEEKLDEVAPDFDLAPVAAAEPEQGPGETCVGVWKSMADSETQLVLTVELGEDGGEFWVNYQASDEPAFDVLGEALGKNAISFAYRETSEKLNLICRPGEGEAQIKASDGTTYFNMYLLPYG